MYEKKVCSINYVRYFKKQKKNPLSNTTITNYKIIDNYLFINKIYYIRLIFIIFAIANKLLFAFHIRLDFAENDNYVCFLNYFIY